MNTTLQGKLEKSILIASLQKASDRHMVVPPILFGGLYSDMNGVLIYDFEYLEITGKKESLRIDMNKIEKVELSFVFRKHAIRGLPTIIAYIDICIYQVDENSNELNTCDDDEVVSLIEIFIQHEISIIDNFNVMKLLNTVKDFDNGFYKFMQKNRKELADKYQLEYPKTTFSRNIK